MKKILIIMLILIPAFLSAANSDSKTFGLNAVIPEGYGVRIPDNAVRVGDFLFSLDIRKDSNSVIQNTELSAGVLSGTNNSFEFVVLYYGNSAEPYDVTIRFSSDGFAAKDSDDTKIAIPVTMSVRESVDAPDDISVETVGINEAKVYIPPAGPRERAAILDVVMEWDPFIEVIPGSYEAALDIVLEGK